MSIIENIAWCLYQAVYLLHGGSSLVIRVTWHSVIKGSEPGTYITMHVVLRRPLLKIFFKFMKRRHTLCNKTLINNKWKKKRKHDFTKIIFFEISSSHSSVHLHSLHVCVVFTEWISAYCKEIVQIVSVSFFDYTRLIRNLNQHYASLHTSIIFTCLPTISTWGICMTSGYISWPFMIPIHYFLFGEVQIGYESVFALPIAKLQQSFELAIHLRIDVYNYI